MKKFIFKLYENLPKNVIDKFGKSSILKPLRDYALRENGQFRKMDVIVRRDYAGYKTEFNFNASIKIAEKAKSKGIENTLLRNSIKLLSSSGNASDAVIFDVGANFGYLSLVWANTVSKNKGVIYSFEPNPFVYDCFSKSVSDNNLTEIIKHFNFAVGRESGKAKFYFAETSSNLNREFEESGISEIKIVSLDDFTAENKIERCHMIKIDVDGIEYEILNGAVKTIEKFKPLLVIETNNDRKILEFVFSKNYSIFDMKLNKVNPGDEIPSNIFCVNGDLKSD